MWCWVTMCLQNSSITAVDSTVEAEMFGLMMAGSHPVHQMKVTRVIHSRSIRLKPVMTQTDVRSLDMKVLCGGAD